VSIIDNGAWELSLVGTRGDETTGSEFPIHRWHSDRYDVHADQPVTVHVPQGATVTGYQLHLDTLTWERGPVLNPEHFPHAGSYTLTRVPRDAFRLALASWVDSGQWDHTRDRVMGSR
jgi:hypothetical protein